MDAKELERQARARCVLTEVVGSGGKKVNEFRPGAAPADENTPQCHQRHDAAATAREKSR